MYLSSDVRFVHYSDGRLMHRSHGPSYQIYILLPDLFGPRTMFLLQFSPVSIASTTLYSFSLTHGQHSCCLYSKQVLIIRFISHSDFNFAHTAESSCILHKVDVTDLDCGK